MESNKPKLMEMIETENGYNLNNFSPFFLHDHIYEILEKSKKALQIYTDLNNFMSVDNFEKVLKIVREVKSLEKAKESLIKEYGISNTTAEYLINLPLSECYAMVKDNYVPKIEIYQEAIKVFEVIAEQQKEIDKHKDELIFNFE